MELSSGWLGIDGFEMQKIGWFHIISFYQTLLSEAYIQGNVYHCVNLNS